MNFVNLVNGKKVFVLGSAPNASIDECRSCDQLVAINSSHSWFPSLIPDVLVINAYSLQDRNDVQRATKNSLRGRVAKHVVAVTTACSFEEMLTSLKGAGLEWQTAEELTREHRYHIAERALGRAPASDRGNDVSSTGVTVLAWAALAGASCIHFSGFSLTGGHSYIVGNTPRYHIDIDREVLSRLGVRDLNRDSYIEPRLVRWLGR